MDATLLTAPSPDILWQKEPSTYTYISDELLELVHL